MSTPRSPHESRWRDLTARARRDAAPPVDTPALLRALRPAMLEPRRGWLTDLALAFPGRRAVSLCLSGTVALAVMTGWTTWNLWEALPWAQMIAASSGGSP